ncbi:unnamed protein product, partial [Brassica oleracea var. botrytis]
TPAEETSERIPASQRLGHTGTFSFTFGKIGVTSSVQPSLKRKPGRAPLRRTTPLSLAMINAGIRKRRVSKTTRPYKTIPRNEENIQKTFPRREENSSRTIPKRSGLAILWKDWLNLEVISSCNSYFDTRVTYGGNMSYATFVYA